MNDHFIECKILSYCGGGFFVRPKLFVFRDDESVEVGPATREMWDRQTRFLERVNHPMDPAILADVTEATEFVKVLPHPAVARIKEMKDGQFQLIPASLFHRLLGWLLAKMHIA